MRANQDRQALRVALVILAVTVLLVIVGRINT